MARRLTHLNPKTTLFLMVDIQEKFRSAMILFDRFVENTSRLCAACKIFNVPLLVTEQNPARLGKTVKELDIAHAKLVVPKTVFNVMIIPQIECEIQKLFNGGKPCDVIVAGAEAHVCVLNTALAILARNINVLVPVDCMTSRVGQDRDMAILRLRDAGCVITTGETIIYELLKDSNDPKFKQLRKILLARSQDMLINQTIPTPKPSPKSKV
ncbi:hypothetical protein DOY81_010079 [Sarcophaga bullata]|nr:hypothetical protein DOY81_010079 [Sarcophaga bullata]